MSVGRGEVTEAVMGKRERRLWGASKLQQGFWFVLLFVFCVKVGVKQGNGLIGLLARTLFLLLRKEYRKVEPKQTDLLDSH